MKAVLVIIAVLVIFALIIGGSYVSHRNQMVTLNETSQVQLGAGGRSAPAPR